MPLVPASCKGTYRYVARQAFCWYIGYRLGYRVNGLAILLAAVGGKQDIYWPG